MSLSSFSAEDKERAGLVHQPKVVNSKPYVVEPWTPKVIQYEKPDHKFKQFKGKDVEKKYWTVGQVADLLGVKSSLIRFWEMKFDIHIRRTGGNHVRQFTIGDVALLREIYHLLKEDRYTIEGALMKMKRTGKTEI